MSTDRFDRNFKEGNIVRHFKGGFYRIVGTAVHSETGEILIVYSQLYVPYNLFARPREIFRSKVDLNKHPNADQPYRFMKVMFPNNSECWSYVRTL